MNKQKVGILPKIIIAVGMAIIFALGILYYVEASKGELSYFTDHFLIGIVLIIVGCIAMFLPSVSKKSFSGDDKGDNMMIGVGILLIICALVAILTSYL